MKLFAIPALVLTSLVVGVICDTHLKECDQICGSAYIPYCAFKGCYLTVDHCAVNQLNCERIHSGRIPLLIVAKGKCASTMLPKCTSFEY